MKTIYIKFFAAVDSAATNALMNVIDQKVHEGYEKIVLLISTPGGSVFHGLSIHNYLMGIPLEIETHNFGSVDSIGVVIFSAGAKRYSAPDARFLLHPVSAGINGNLESEKIEEILKGMKIDTINISSTISKATLKTVEEITDSINKRTTLSPEEAKEFGLVHEIKQDLFPKNAEVLSINVA
ncbi:ATP-dependent Clp protease proteolytic subunit [uncultured Flavobacterium sp.]|uniref:ClpP family protease n=1 Tax=uncultured Flavobacterium sp. TaxID=165435 RepID=UPI0030EB623A|tara:strand:- start:4870 stop:5415 length:546 start_codon:yes stop_codon:yes gene_type:complete